MQNTVYERKRNGADFILLHSVTTVHFGNRAANVLVTEQPQYSVVICIFFTWQNTEILLISNGFRFIFTCPLFLAQPITFHLNRHTFATKRPVVERFCGYLYASIQYDGGKEYPLQVDANGLYATSQRVSVVNDPNGGGLWNYIAAFNLSTIHYVTMAE